MLSYKSWWFQIDPGFVLSRVYTEGETDTHFLSDLKGSGKAFCSGGDVVTLYHLLTEGQSVMNPFIYLAFNIFFSDSFYVLFLCFIFK